VAFSHGEISAPAFIRGDPYPLLSAVVTGALWARGGVGRTVAPMRHRARELATRAVPAVALALAAGVVAGCASAAATGTATGGASASATRAAAPVYGPPGVDPACLAAEKAKQTLVARQSKDENNQSALDQDFTDFASELSADAGREKRPSAARAMTALASDYTALVQSQSGAGQLPDMSQVQNDGTAFDKACSP
jgi:hypothetical protein